MSPCGWSTKRMLRIAQRQLLARRHRFDHGRVEARAGERIAEALLQALDDVGAGVQRDRRLAALGDRAKLVDAVAMVGMVVGDDQRVDVADVGVEQLLAKVGPAVDQQALAGAFDQQRGAKPAVARLSGVAGAPVVADPGHAGRGAAAQDPQFHAAARPNNR